MKSGLPRGRPCLRPVVDAVMAVLGPFGDASEVACHLHVYAYDPADLVAIYVDGDWQYDGEGEVVVERLFGDLADQIGEDKLLAAIVIRGNLVAPNAVLVDFDSDWAPALIVGGNVQARAMCLSGAVTQILGDLTLESTLYGWYNHGSLEVGGATSVPVILSSDFSMAFQGKVDCAHVLAANGALNIAAHYQDDTLGQVMQADFLDGDDSPIAHLVMDAIAENRSLLRAPDDIGKPAVPTVSQAGRAALAALAAQAGPILSIELRDCDLTFVPDDVARYTDARSLDLAGNAIHALPDTLATLQQLEQLDLSNCRLEALPDWVAHLPRLRVLKLERNDLTRWPQVAGGFPALEVLEVGNPFGDSAAHDAWVWALPLAQFPRLHSYANRLNVSSEVEIGPDYNAWESASVEHLRITPTLEGALPTCLLRMPQLRTLDLQLSAQIAPLALPLLAQLGHLEALQLSYGRQDNAFNQALAAALPATLVRLDNTRTLDAAIADGKRLLERLTSEGAWDAALLEAERQIARVEAAWAAIPAHDHEAAYAQKLAILCGMAGATPPGPRKSKQIGVAAQYADQLLESYRRVSASSMWTLSFTLGRLRAECLLTQAWSLLRREQPDHAAATALLSALEREITTQPNARHVSTQVQREIASLRALIA